ncbi:MAG: hypothetical protein K8H75_08810 [Sulfuricella sp.]|nr:hypothetical protein [Sulfuricella sp.]
MGIDWAKHWQDSMAAIDDLFGSDSEFREVNDGDMLPDLNKDYDSWDEAD